MDKTTNVPNRLKCWLRRALKNHATMTAAGKVVEEFFETGLDGRKRRNEATKRVAAANLTSFRGARGHSSKCPWLDENLWQWFVDIRSSVKTTMSPRYLLSRAKMMADGVVAAMNAKGEYIEVPTIDMRYCRRWRENHGVVLLQPNRRYKVSWSVMVERLCAMWMNNFRVRFAAEHFLGKDLADSIFGIDEKPIHYNEAGSKAVQTLHFEGAPYCALRTNHSASRDRLSLMTMVTTWRELCKCAKGPPVALCCRAKSDRKLAAIKLPGKFRISLDWSDSGSYNEPRFLAYLDQWLQPWSDERAASRDYRLLYFDVAASHLNSAGNAGT